MLHTFMVGWAEWWDSVPPEIALLAALPFGAAAVAIAADRVKRLLAARRHPARSGPDLTARKLHR